MLRGFSILLFAVWLCTSRAAVVTCDGDFASLSNAVYNLVGPSGDTILINRGFWTNTGHLWYTGTKTFNVRGWGTNNTVIYFTDQNSFWHAGSGTNAMWWSDMTCIDVVGHSGAILSYGKNPPSVTTYKPFVRVTRTHFDISGRAGVVLGSGGGWGVIDNCVFSTPYTNWQGNHFYALGNEYLSWADVNPLGSTNAVYVESSRFYNRGGSLANGFYDAYNGAQLTIRFNLFDGTANNGAHGYDSQVTSTRTGEVYGNLYTNVDIRTTVNDWRGGTFLWFSNRIATVGGTVNPAYIKPLLKYYRGCDGIVNTISNWCGLDQVLYFAANPSDGQSLTLIYQPAYTFKNSPSANRHVKIGATLADTISNLVSCINVDPAGAGTRYYATSTANNDVRARSYTGTTINLYNVLDGTGTHGWPGAQQHGIISALPGTNTVTRYPCYSWENRYDGVKAGFGLAFSTDVCNGHNYIADLLQDGRDYFDDTTVNWTGPPPGYTPLPYPHPAITAGFGPTDRAFVIVSSTGGTVTAPLDLFATAASTTTVSGSGSRYYPEGGAVSVTAPSNSGGRTFSKWRVDGADYTTNATIEVTATADRTLEAVYAAGGGGLEGSSSGGGGSGSTNQPVSAGGSVRLRGAVNLRKAQ